MPLPSATFERSGGGRFKIDGHAMRKMTGYAQRLPGHPEAGGLLLGRHILDSCDMVVDVVTVPMPGDLRTEYGFRRRSKMHQVLMERAWRDSKQTCTYLGEWHTHPQAVPVPSMVDKENWRIRMRDDLYEGDTLFFIILGTERMVVWEVKRDASAEVAHWRLSQA
jgi:integrative and conjugative element protein (TIGR02256 family)